MFFFFLYISFNPYFFKSIESSAMNEELFQKSYDTVKFDLQPEKYIDNLVQYDSDQKIG